METPATIDRQAAAPTTRPRLGVRGWTMLIVLAVLAIAPYLLFKAGHGFYLDVATRAVILSIAAVGLNFILGYGGMISFGHAAYLGIGAYSVGIPAYYGVYDGLVHFPLAIAASALFALLTGAVCLRTRGVYFIMITMAFAQMVYYAFVSLEEYGGDDGLVINARSRLPVIDLESNIQLYYLSFVSLVALLYVVHRIVNSRFGMVVQGSKGNDERMRAIGYHTYVYRLVAYVISGAICGYAGALLANFSSFISPEMTYWTRSGELIFMVILGGTGSLFGPVLGAVGFLALEEILSSFTVYWPFLFGVILIMVVLFARRGIDSLLGPRDGHG